MEGGGIFSVSREVFFFEYRFDLCVHLAGECPEQVGNLAS